MIFLPRTNAFSLIAASSQPSGIISKIFSIFLSILLFISLFLSVRKCLGADEIYKETWIWLKNRGCEKLVNKRLLESYSLAFARFIQCEDELSTYGLLGKHTTTGGVVASPFASLSQSYQKQANLLWYEIFDIVKQNCTTKFDGSPQDDMMEQLLRSRK